MPMKSDQELDRCIETLFQRVQALEDEVARLKGKPLTTVSQKPQQSMGQASHQKLIPSQEKKKFGFNNTSDNSLERTIGTRWLGRIGVLAILFGVAFFLKYSFENKLIGEAGRIMLGLFWGIAFLAAGEYFQKKKGLMLYGQMLSGGGLAILYLALYAGFALYHLIPAALAATGMLAVTSTGMTLSIRYSSYPLAAIGLLGGFLSPIMLSTGSNQPVTLFGYILALDIATLLLLRFRPWPSLVAASLIGTILLYTGWHQEFFSDEQLRLAFGIITTFFVFYTLYILISRQYSQRGETDLDLSIIFGSTAFFFLGFFAQHHFAFTWPVKIFTPALAAGEIGLAMVVGRFAPSARKTLAAFTAVSIIMTVIAAFVTLEKGWILPALTTEMAILGWIGLRLDWPYLRRGAYLLALVVLFRFANDIQLFLEPFEAFTPLYNSRFLTCLTAIAGFYVLTSFLGHYRGRLVAEERHMFGVTFVTSQALSLLLLSVEIHDFFHFRSPGQALGWGSTLYAYQLSLSVLWALYATILTGVGIAKKIRGARILGILLLGATILKVFLVDLSELQTVYRIISFIVLGLLLLSVSYFYNRFKHFIFGEDQQ
jgi:uncharacterized membrane protein